MSFKDLQLNRPILRAVAEAGYDNPTLVQEKTIPLVLEKKDVIVSAQTGTGKTEPCTAYALLALFAFEEGVKSPYTTGSNTLCSGCLTCGNEIKSHGLWETKDKLISLPFVSILINLNTPIKSIIHLII